ncbi:MAG: restriction endonuclease [Gammaproteobacteria bacterium]|nr:restriction endonuclease [Gammaproteobacteria bacterium]
MQYDEFANLFNKTIFEKSKIDLLKKIAKYPARYVGLFRPSQPKTKIIQNLLQSHEIRFGDAFEALVEKYLVESGYTILEKKFSNGSKSRLDVDQIFSKENSVFFVEQKIRDDHDSAKKRGQIDNFEKKIAVIKKKYESSMIKGFFYFVDTSLSKNQKFYEEEIAKLSRGYGVPLKLIYGSALFDNLGHGQVWPEILEHLKKWQQSIPELPEINFDKDAQESFDEIKQLPPSTYTKLFSNHKLDELLRVLFPSGRALALLADYFAQQHQSTNRRKYKTLQDMCAETAKRLAGK